MRRWLHSHEEDADAAKVYRPDDYPFPPARGRMGFELKPDGSLLEALIRILLTDHPDARWVDIRPTIEWALAARGGVEETLLGMVLRREIQVSETTGLRLKLRASL